MKCKKCGTEFEGNFCSKCGTPVMQPVVNQQPLNTNDSMLNTTGFPQSPQQINNNNKKKAVYKNWWFWVVIIAALIGIGVIGNVSKNLSGNSSNTTSSITEQAKSDVDNETTAENTEQPTTEEPTTVAQAETEVYAHGTQKNPAKLGDTIEIETGYIYEATTLEMTITNVKRGNEALELIQEYNMFNDSPPDGYEYVLFDVVVECKETVSDSGYDISYFDFAVASDDFTVIDNKASVVLKNELDATLYSNSKTTGQVCLAVPQDNDGYAVFNDTYFFKLK